MTPEGAFDPAVFPFHPATRAWFDAAFAAPTPAQVAGWVPIARGDSTLLLAPTGSGKTLAAFLVALDRLCFGPPAAVPGVRVLYVSPLKALGVDVSRNLRAPLAGLAAHADRIGGAWHRPTVGVRTGDTPAAERARLARKPPDILITTPESLYLWLTSEAARGLASVEAVIVDEIHALVGTKRGTHLALSLERLEAWRVAAGNTVPLQRIGLSATQRPLDESARFLGGGDVDPVTGAWRARPVTIVDASAPKRLSLSVDMPAEEHLLQGITAWQAEAGAVEAVSDPGSAPPSASRSLWPAIHPKLLALIRAHRSTLVFVNSRRLAERLAAALNELAGEEIARAHHGSVSREARAEIEERLKAGTLPALLATSTLELGIDMGSIDLVIQIEAPFSVASALQRIGRAGHHVGGTSTGHLFPKFRGDLLACAALTERMDGGLVEETRYPRNPLDVLTQHIVATVAMGPRDADALYALARGAAPFAHLPRDVFDGVLDLVSGRYPTQALGSLTDARPALVYDRSNGRLSPRAHARRLAVLNGGTIPDRGLYGVYLAEAGGGDTGTDADPDANTGTETRTRGKRPSRRVGELDEEMVLESRPGEVFVLGATSWRIEEITHDRVLVTPAGAQPGKMPFWRAEGAGRAFEFGEAIGGLVRRLEHMPEAQARATLRTTHHLGDAAIDVLLAYLNDQRAATRELPTDRLIVVERFRDEIGDWRVCVLSPFGARVHAAWVTAVSARIRALVPGEVEMFWTDDGFAFRLPDQGELPDLSALFPGPDEVEDLVVAHLAETSLFAARFRENAARALLLPKRDPRRRTPLWQLRKRAQDLMAAALAFPSFPIVLETYRECLRDAYDVPSLKRVLERIARREIRVTHVDTPRPSPFAASLLFGFVATFLYDGDQPVAERRARALTLDVGRLRALLGEDELRSIFEVEEIDAIERRLQCLEPRLPGEDPETLHDLCRRLGCLSADELERRLTLDAGVLPSHLAEMVARRRLVPVRVAGEPRYIVVEDVARYRDALGVVPPPGTPSTFLEPTTDPLTDLVARFARTHGPFTAEAVAGRFGHGPALARLALERLVAADRIVTGAFRPGQSGVEYCDAEVLRALKRHALARLRAAVEPVPPERYARFLCAWQGLTSPRRGLDALLSVIEQLQGVPVPASVLEREVLPARVADYVPGMLDALCVAGEVVWRGVESIGERDGRIALYLTDAVARLAPDRAPLTGPVYDTVRSVLSTRGAMFFGDLAKAVGGFPRDVEAALWVLIWNGEVTNDTLAPLRSRLRGAQASRGGAGARRRAGPFGDFTSRRAATPGTEGRFSMLTVAGARLPGEHTEHITARVLQALERDGVLVREAALCEGLSFSDAYPVLKALESTGRLRRGYFVEGLGATQFALPGADERLRLGTGPADAVGTGGIARVEGVALAACDPANPYGAALTWPKAGDGRLQRAAGCSVVLVDGRLCAYLGRGGRSLTLAALLPEAAELRADALDAVTAALGAAIDAGRLEPLTIAEIDGEPAEPRHPFAAAFARAGFQVARLGFTRRRVFAGGAASPQTREPGDDDDVFDADAGAGAGESDV